MADKALYILAGFDDVTEGKLTALQNRLYEQGFSGVQTKGIPMHFTLGSYLSEQEEELKQRLLRISEEHKSFEVDFSHVGLFRLSENDVLFIKPEVNKAMLKLKDEFTDSSDPYGWSSHTTMLIDRPQIISEALQIVMGEFSSFSGKTETLHLYEFWPARHILSVKLKG